MPTIRRAAASSLAAAALLSPLVLVAAGAGAEAGPAASHRPRCDQPGPYELPHGSEPVDLDPADFSARITNPYWPMAPGTRWVYAEKESDGARLKVVVLSLDRTREIAGIDARVVRDVVTEVGGPNDGEIVEKTFDWYAQDSGGSVWYMGEFTREYEDGEPVNTEGSFEHGVDGAQAGVVVPARPVPGCSYRQEYYEGEAEDRGRTLTLKDDIRVRGEEYRDLMTTSDRVPTEPYVLEHKFYAPGIGPVLAVGVSPKGSREELVSYTAPR